MITGNKVKEIIGYLPIDHNADGVGWVRPEAGEKFLGHPYGWDEVGSVPFIEVVGDNQILRTVNCLDVAEIEFATE